MNIESKITKNTILFFDMDGTLVDTNYANFLSYKKAIQSVTNEHTDLIYNPEQRFDRTELRRTIPGLSISEYENIINEKERCYNNFLSETKLIKEMFDILCKYSKTNKTALVTNCRENRAMETLKYHSLEDKFSNIFCRQLSDNTVHINKFSNAIAKLNILPQSIIVFENVKIEIDDAIRAGIPSDNIVELINL
ncbi:MAG: HAD family hydrolase [Bacteroidales bacterium]|jgi:beta-phosphoglucomutase-like phosphatase (HAD superfamily)|nr:HAD family hydrolase [Bacteroidales bacterium]